MSTPLSCESATGSPSCEVIFIRHGETDWNKAKRLQGNLDIPLNDTGRRQVREAAAKLRYQISETPGTLPLTQSHRDHPLGLAAIIASPLSRTTESAQIVAEEIGYPEGNIIYNDAVQEWNAGELQVTRRTVVWSRELGLNISLEDLFRCRSLGFYLHQLEEQFPQAWKAWRVTRDPHYEFNGGESFAQRRERVVKAVQSIANNYPNQRVIIVTHSGVIDEVFRRAKNVPLQNFTRIPKLNAGVYIVRINCITDPEHQDSHLEERHSHHRDPVKTGPCSKVHHGHAMRPPKWKILRWGLQRVSDRQSSINFNVGCETESFDPFSTEYA